MTSTRAPGALRHPCPKAGSAIPSPRLEDPPGRGPCGTQSHGARWPPQPARPRLPFSLGLSRTASRGRVLLGLLSRVLCPQAQPQPPCWLSRGRGRGRLRSPVTVVPTCRPSSSVGLREACSRQAQDSPSLGFLRGWAEGGVPSPAEGPACLSVCSGSAASACELHLATQTDSAIILGRPHRVS